MGSSLPHCRHIALHGTPQAASELVPGAILALTPCTLDVVVRQLGNNTPLLLQGMEKRSESARLLSIIRNGRPALEGADSRVVADVDVEALGTCSNCARYYTRRSNTPQWLRNTASTHSCFDNA